MKIATTILIICILNFIAFFIGSSVIGGSAPNGYEKDGRYFLSEHGKETEVTKQVWDYSLWHTRSLIVTHPLAMILTLILGMKWDEKRKQKIKQDKANKVLPGSPQP